MKRILGTTLVLISVVLAGCGSDDDDSSDPDLPSAATSSNPATTDSAPSMQNPRDAFAIKDRPCEALSAEQLASKGFDQPGVLEPGSALLSPSCIWFDQGRSQRISLSVNSSPTGLDGVFASRADFDEFEVVAIGGNPAVLRKALADSGGCSSTVLAAETELLDVSFDFLNPGTPDPCGPARELAQIAFDNLAPVG